MVKLSTGRHSKIKPSNGSIKSGFVSKVRLFSQTKNTLFLSFAAELTLSLSVLFILLLQFMQFGVFSFSRNYSDSSIAATFLAQHPEVNPELFDKSHTSKTLVSRTSFVPQALAENTLPSDGKAEELPEDDLTDFNNFVINENSIVAPNPDSVSKLIERQIKIYETKPEDTLSSIASANGLKVQTLIWANNLKNSTIQPGWKLLIPPTDGVVYKADSNDTLPDLSRRFGVKLEKIISYNGLENAEDIEPDQVFIIPDGKIAPPPAPKPAVDKKKKDKKVTPKTSGYAGRIQGDHIFPWGYCTWYVATKIPVDWGGNANQWMRNAPAFGATISREPAPGSIIVTSENSRYGHVGYVESVNDDGSVTFSEMNYKGLGIRSVRTIPAHGGVVRGYIIP